MIRIVTTCLSVLLVCAGFDGARAQSLGSIYTCLLYTSDAADE